MAKLGHRLKQRQAYSPISTQAKPPEMPAPQLEGDTLLAFLREHDPASIPTPAELAAVELQGVDVISDVAFCHHALYENHLFAASVDEVRRYFEREGPTAIQSDDGARLNGYHREQAERVGRPSARWGMGEALTGPANPPGKST